MQVKPKHPSVIDTLISASHYDLINQAICLLLALYSKEIHENLLSLHMDEMGNCDKTGRGISNMTDNKTLAIEFLIDLEEKQLEVYFGFPVEQGQGRLLFVFRLQKVFHADVFRCNTLRDSKQRGF